MRALVLGLAVNLMLACWLPASACKGGGAEMPTPRTVSVETELLFDKGRRLEEAGRIEDAISAYKSAERGEHGGAAFALGNIYSEGRKGVPPDAREARKWYEIAGVLGVPLTKATQEQFSKAVLLDGDGRTKESLRYYVQAARAGHGLAAKALGDIYEGGKNGVARDYGESLKWYSLSEKLGVYVTRCRGK